jgi:predicted dehydrogenase
LHGVRLAAVADVAVSRCAAVAPGVPAYDSAEALVASAQVDAIVVATPAAMHLAHARLAASAGLPVLVEKPPAPDPEQAAALAALAPMPWVGFNRRFDRGLQRMREAALGQERVDLYLELGYERSAWSPHVVADDVLDDLGSHLADLARWIAGDVVRVRAVDADARRAHVELELGRGRAELVCASDRAHVESFVLRDARGRRLAAHRLGGVRGALRRLAHPRTPNSLVASLVGELEAFAGAARGDDDLQLARATDGLAAMVVVDAVRRSAEAGGEWQAVGS